MQHFYLSRHIPYFFIAGVCKIYSKAFQATFVFVLRDKDMLALPNGTDVSSVSRSGRGVKKVK